MRITCPACAATYEVPDRLIGTGRSLRCRSCGHAWRVTPEEPGAEAAVPAPAGAAAEAPPPPLPDPGTLPDPPAALPGPRRAPQLIDPPLPRPEALPRPVGTALRLAWAASLIAVLAGLAGLWLFRAEIAEAWPPAARLYRILGTTAQG